MSAFEQYLPHVDVEGGLRRIGGSKPLYIRLLNMFATSAEFSRFEETLAANDLPAAGDVAHAIKGMSGNLSVNTVFEITTRLCEELRAGQRDEALLAEYEAARAQTLAYLPEIIDKLEA